jgi:hypothetical protein
MRSDESIGRFAVDNWGTQYTYRDTLQKFGIWGFCQNFLQKYYDSLERFHFLARLHNSFG